MQSSTQTGLLVRDLHISTNKKSRDDSKRTRRSIVSGVDIMCRKGKTLAILGASGSGKSTILSYLSGRLKASRHYRNTAEVTSWNGQAVDCRDLGKMSYFVPCHSELLPFLSAEQSVTFEEGLRGGCNRNKNDLHEVLKSVGLPSHATKHSVNGYMSAPLTDVQLRKLGLAMAVTANADIILFDEPTSFVSESNALDILNFIGDTTRSRSNIAVITLHQPSKEQLNKMDQLLILTRQGECAFRGTPEEVFEFIKNSDRKSDGTVEYVREVLFGKYGGEEDSDETDSSLSIDQLVSCAELTKTPRMRRSEHKDRLTNQTECVPRNVDNARGAANMELRTAETDHCVNQPRKSRSFSDLKLLILIRRTFYFRFQNPIVVASVTGVMVIMAIFFGWTFINTGSKLDKSIVNNEIVIPNLNLPVLSDELTEFTTSWFDAIMDGVGPFDRLVFQETLFPQSSNRLVSNEDEVSIEYFLEATRKTTKTMQDSLDALMDLTMCSTHYWRMVVRWPESYQEVIEGTYEMMMKDNPKDSQVRPVTKISTQIDSAMDKMAITVHEIALLGDYLLHKSNIFGLIDVCLERNEGALFWFCARGMLRQLDGPLACLGINAFNESHEYHSPWASIEMDPTRMADLVMVTKATTANELSPIQLLLTPLVGGISLGAGMVFILAVVAFGCFPIIIHYYQEREGANRDSIAGAYPIATFFLAKTVGDIPFEIIPVLIMSSIFCGFIGLQGYDFFVVVLMSVGVAWAHGGTAYLFTAMSRRRDTPMGLFSVWTFVSLLFSGFMLRVNDMPDWCSWLRFASPIYWAYGGCMCVFYEPVDGLSVGNIVLISLGVTDDYQRNIITCTSALLLMGIGFRLSAALCQFSLHRDIGTQSDYYSN